MCVCVCACELCLSVCVGVCKCVCVRKSPFLCKCFFFWLCVYRVCRYFRE